jgi:hypothetical protein
MPMRTALNVAVCCGRIKFDRRQVDTVHNDAQFVVDEHGVQARDSWHNVHRKLSHFSDVLCVEQIRLPFKGDFKCPSKKKRD